MYAVSLPLAWGSTSYVYPVTCMCRVRLLKWAADSVLERVRVKHNSRPALPRPSRRGRVATYDASCASVIPIQTLVAALCQRLAPGASLRTVRIGQRAAALCESALVG